jgi:hypothetical protein
MDFMLKGLRWFISFGLHLLFIVLRRDRTVCFTVHAFGYKNTGWVDVGMRDIFANSSAEM